LDSDVLVGLLAAELARLAETGSLARVESLPSSIPSARLEHDAQIFGLRERLLLPPEMGSPQHMQIDGLIFPPVELLFHPVLQADNHKDDASQADYQINRK
jgi:hypothetical protein